MSFYPNADRSVVGNSSGSHLGGPYKGVLHTTEGSSASGAISAFRNNNSWPHFLVDYAGKVWQFIDTALAARALRNLSGGVETNRDSAIQIEVVGFAGKPNEHPAAQIDALRALMRWIESATGTQPVGPGKAFATAYGQNNLRFSNSEWDNFNGWCGHCHVPENDHWDPGAIDLSKLLPPPGFKVPASYYTEVPIVPFSVSRPQGGYLVVGQDGGVFTYDTPFYGSLAGVGAKVIAGAWTLTGQGYWLLGDDGAIFSFGDATYRQAFNTLPANVKGNRKPVGLVATSDGGYTIITIDPSNDGSPFDPYHFV